MDFQPRWKLKRRTTHGSLTQIDKIEIFYIFKIFQMWWALPQYSVYFSKAHLYFSYILFPVCDTLAVKRSFIPVRLVMILSFFFYYYFSTFWNLNQESQRIPLGRITYSRTPMLKECAFFCSMRTQCNCLWCKYF